MAEVQKHVLAGVRMICDQLTDEELNAITMVGLMGTNPQHVMGYEKAKMLFQSDGTMHAIVKDALTIIHEERFPEPTIYRVPRVNWLTEMAQMLEQAKEGDILVVYNENVLEIAQSALKRRTDGKHIRIMTEETYNSMQASPQQVSRFQTKLQ